MMQLELFSTRALVKADGALYVVSISKPANGKQGKCPVCSSPLVVSKAPYGWLECQSCFNFAILESDYSKIAHDWNLDSQLG